MFDTYYFQHGVGYMPSINQVKLSYEKDPNNNEGIHYVMWSGGCDSTLLLYELLEAYGPERVVAISYKYPWLHDIKYQNEVKHREAFKAEMKKRDPKYANIRHIEFNIAQNAINGEYINVNTRGLPQAVAWLLSIPLHVTSGSYVYDGTIKDDDLVLFMEGYHEIFRGIRKVLCKDIILRQPYLLLNKYQIIEKLINYGLYDLVWYCEMPKAIEELCGNCVPCKTHAAALTYLSMYSCNENVRIKAKDILNGININIEDNNTKYSDNIEMDMNEDDNIEMDMNEDN